MAVRISTKNMSREEWLLLRKSGIGGSDAGAIYGVNPYKSAFSVFIDKTTGEYETEDSEKMRQGRDLEGYCARRFMEATGFKVRRTNFMYRSEEYPFMIADVDRVIVGENAGLECKTCSAWSYEKWKNEESIPESYVLQCQHYMAVMGYDYMYLACVILGVGFEFYKIERDEEQIKNLIMLEQEFWENNVLTGVIPEPDGSKAYDYALGIYFDVKKDAAIPLVGFDKDLDRRSELSKSITKMETEKKEIEQKLKLFLNENEIAENNRYRVTWKRSETTGQRRLMVKEVAA